MRNSTTASVTSGLHTPDAVVYPSSRPTDPAPASGGLTAVCATFPQNITDFVGEWAFVRVLSCHEKKATSLFLRDGVQCYLPLYREKQAETPLFTNYVFICGDNEQSWYDVIRLHTSGGKRIVTMAQAIRDQARFIRQLTNIQTDLAADRIKPYHLPTLGDKCRVTEGPWRDFEGTIERAGDQRLFVLRIFGQAKVLEIEPHKLEILD